MLKAVVDRDFRMCLVVAVCAVMLPALATASDDGEISLASDSWPPFTEEAGRQRVALELVHTALERAGYAAATTIVDWRVAERGIREGRYDGSAAMWWTNERERQLFFSDPYMENRLILVGRRGSDVSAARMADLNGKKVAAVSRYAYGPEFETAAGVLFVRSRNDQDSLTKLLAEEVDYMLVDELVARYLMQHQPDEVSANLEIGKKLLARRSLHLALRHDVPNVTDIIEAFNTEIHDMLMDGTYAKVLQMGWVRIDIDGDGLDELVTLAEVVGEVPPGTVYDVFGDEPETPPEKQRVFVAGSIYEGWDAIPENVKSQGPAGVMDPSIKQGTTAFTLKF
jgi:polar amino acid transport system substrate-binding protein